MGKERENQEPNIIEILNQKLREGTSDPELAKKTVESIADDMGIDFGTLNWWLDNDALFKKQLMTVNETLEKDPDRDKAEDTFKLDSMVLSFGITFVLEETKKRYTV